MTTLSEGETMEISTQPRRFHLIRHRDISGVSGTGVVAEGAVWSSGAVALHWPGHPRATSVWASLDDVRIAHGHQGATEVRFLDAETDPQPDRGGHDEKGWPLLKTATETDQRTRGWMQFDDSAVIELPDEREAYDPRD